MDVQNVKITLIGHTLYTMVVDRMRQKGRLPKTWRYGVKENVKSFCPANRMDRSRANRERKSKGWLVKPGHLENDRY